ncbi:PLD nuclease N-terminal domain-containing protein [Oerskovia sp. KBS0722]|uniref:PLD nuclease N-terminal domain-containing protein n=1 Tax=Oerskovia sp. KBS0722 TaxID=1179673 RepID=UPI00110EEA2A|nr:PLD nuclease N-terminal domain-containing protein [Oerskovia sp. KBS0722]QDW62504.1 PLDc_N domain-containing protein [Oerskovia sp. KBS0722]
MSRVLLTLLAVGLAVYALSDCATSDENDRSGIPKGLWIVMIIFLPFVGPLAWIIVSRTQRARHATTGGAPTPGRARPGARRRPAAPLAPDDDPDFLWKLEQQRRRDARGEGTDQGPTTGPGPGGSSGKTHGTSDDDAPRENPSGETDGAPGTPSSGSTDPS